MKTPRHGGARDRGSADSYYGRPRDPHLFAGRTYTSARIVELNADEVEEYNAGYDENERRGDRKDWG